jgi:hypothetical protein
MTDWLGFSLMKTHVSCNAASAYETALVGTPLTEKAISARVFFFLHSYRRATIPDSVFGRKFVFSHAALRTDPVVGKILKGSSGGNTVVGIADRRIVHVTARIADILFHRSLLLRFYLVDYRSSHFAGFISSRFLRKFALTHDQFSTKCIITSIKNTYPVNSCISNNAGDGSVMIFEMAMLAARTENAIATITLTIFNTVLFFIRLLPLPR